MERVVSVLFLLTVLVAVYAKKIQQLQNEDPNIKYTDWIFDEAAKAIEELVEQKIRIFAHL